MQPVIWFALFGLFWGFVASVMLWFGGMSLLKGPPVTLDRIKVNIGGIVGLLFVISTLLGGILAVLLFQATR